MRSWGRTATAVLAVAAVVATASPAAAGDVRRWGGEDRFATAAVVSAENFPGGAADVVVVNGSSFADALTAAPLAAQRGGPLLMVTATSVPGATREELRRLAPRRIWIVGGTTAVGADVAGELAGLAGEGVRRLQGPDRYATGAAVAREAFPGLTSEVFVASGEGFADALSGGAAAAALGAPLVLTARDSLPASAEEAIRAVAPSRITVVGGPSAVSERVEQQLAQEWPDAVVRLAGDDRYSTSVALVRDTWESAPGVLLASGAGFPDALAGAALGTPLLLAEPGCAPAVVVDAGRALAVDSVIGLGGPSVLSDAALHGVPCS